MIISPGDRNKTGEKEKSFSAIGGNKRAGKWKADSWPKEIWGSSCG
jgi:hypothetical protein